MYRRTTIPSANGRNPLVGSLKIQVSFAEYYLFYRALLQKRLILMYVCTGGRPYRARMEEIHHWAVCIGRALAFLHQRLPPLIHRDLKPSNLLLTLDGRMKGVSCVLSCSVCCSVVQCVAVWCNVLQCCAV